MKKLFKTTFFITLILILLFVIAMCASLFIYGNERSASIGIIGGADGPTVMFVSQSLIFDNPVFLLLGAIIVLFVVSAIGWFVTRKK